MMNGRIKGLDGIRGIAALAVFGVHYNQIVDIDYQIGSIDFYQLITNGDHGVALFFILSGLLLSLPFWRTVLYQQAKPSLKTYFIHRLVRILPAYYVALSILILLSGLWRFEQAWLDILLHYTFLFNYTEFSFFSINPTFWTLAVEMQFYLLLPCMFFMLRRYSFNTMIGSFIIMILVSYSLHYLITVSVNKTIVWPFESALTWVRPHGAVVGQSLLAHLPHFILGVLAGAVTLILMSKNRTEKGGWLLLYDAGLALAVVTLVLLLGTSWGEKIQIPFSPYGFPIIPLILASVTVLIPFSRYAAFMLDSKIMSHLGKVSYGVYIYHLPVLIFVDHKMSMNGLDAREHWAYLAIISGLLTLLAANLSYYLVERPILRAVHKN